MPGVSSLSNKQAKPLDSNMTVEETCKVSRVPIELSMLGTSISANAMMTTLGSLNRRAFWYRDVDTPSLYITRSSCCQIVNSHGSDSLQLGHSYLPYRGSQQYVTFQYCELIWNSNTYHIMLSQGRRYKNPRDNNIITSKQLWDYAVTL